VFQNTACAVANGKPVSASSCTEFELRIEGIVQAEPPKLTLLGPPLGNYQLRLSGQLGSSYTIQTSPDLKSWFNWTNVPGPIFHIDLPEAGQPGSQRKFFRSR
ncbi:MAG: hypothetical protein H0U23_17235, partial [Blastocatellia bacterium]|nr:hypothetical protein [Blastocatellia bacterium]